MLEVTTKLKFGSRIEEKISKYHKTKQCNSPPVLDLIPFAVKALRSAIKLFTSKEGAWADFWAVSSVSISWKVKQH